MSEGSNYSSIYEVPVLLCNYLLRRYWKHNHHVIYTPTFLVFKEASQHFVIK